MFIKLSVIIAPNQEQPKYLSTELIDKQSMVSPYTQLFSHKDRIEVLIIYISDIYIYHGITWMNLENMV